MFGDGNLFLNDGDKETEYLKYRGKRLGQAIGRIGHIDWAAGEDIFSSMVRRIIGQQISAATQATIWRPLKDKVGTATADSLADLSRERLQAICITVKKANYILDFVNKPCLGAFSIADLETLQGDLVTKELPLWKALVFGLRK